MRIVISIMGLVFWLIAEAASAEGTHHSHAFSFEDFPAAAATCGKKAPLQLAPGSPFWVMRTRVREAYQEAPNFADCFIMVEWGCGTECQGGALIDTRTGHIYARPVSSLQTDYRQNSTLLVVNPLWDYYWERPMIPVADPVAYYYCWNGRSFVLLRREPWQRPESQPESFPTVELPLINAPVPTPAPEYTGSVD